MNLGRTKKIALKTPEIKKKKSLEHNEKSYSTTSRETAERTWQGGRVKKKIHRPRDDLARRRVDTIGSRKASLRKYLLTVETRPDWNGEGGTRAAEKRGAVARVSRRGWGRVRKSETKQRRRGTRKEELSRALKSPKRRGALGKSNTNERRNERTYRPNEAKHCTRGERKSRWTLVEMRGETTEDGGPCGRGGVGGGLRARGTGGCTKRRVERRSRSEQSRGSEPLTRGTRG